MEDRSEIRAKEGGARWGEKRRKMFYQLKLVEEVNHEPIDDVKLGEHLRKDAGLSYAVLLGVSFE